ncbi:MAG: hypothetical protein IPK07_29530 [Deltaproteobacteria bacterium]|nr:hypothetical protein [Deltaproteobacteria bacterium]
MVLELAVTLARPNAWIHELLRRFRDERPDFTLVTLTLSANASLLVHAGLAARAITTFCGDSYPAPAPNGVLRRAIRAGRLAVENWSIGTLPLRLEAAAMGVPELPTRSLVGSTMAEENAHAFSVRGGVGWVKPLVPDLTLVHALAADRSGNAILPAPRGEGIVGAFARDGVLVSAERIVSTEWIRRHSHLGFPPPVGAGGGGGAARSAPGALVERGLRGRGLRRRLRDADRAPRRGRDRRRSGALAPRVGDRRGRTRRLRGQARQRADRAAAGPEPRGRLARRGRRARDTARGARGGAGDAGRAPGDRGGALGGAARGRGGRRLDPRGDRQRQPRRVARRAAARGARSAGRAHGRTRALRLRPASVRSGGVQHAQPRDGHLADRGAHADVDGAAERAPAVHRLDRRRRGREVRRAQHHSPGRRYAHHRLGRRQRHRERGARRGGDGEPDAGAVPGDRRLRDQPGLAGARGRHRARHLREGAWGERAGARELGPRRRARLGGGPRPRDPRASGLGSGGSPRPGARPEPAPDDLQILRIFDPKRQFLGPISP